MGPRNPHGVYTIMLPKILLLSNFYLLWIIRSYVIRAGVLQPLILNAASKYHAEQRMILMLFDNNRVSTNHYEWVSFFVSCGAELCNPGARQETPCQTLGALTQDRLHRQLVPSESVWEIQLLRGESTRPHRIRSSQDFGSWRVIVWAVESFKVIRFLINIQ